MSESGKRVAIIGNGFDLAHGYKTQYSQFVDAVHSPVLDNFKQKVEKYRENNGGYLGSWYDFEKIIDLLTYDWFQKYAASGFEDEIGDSNEIKELDQLFHEITVLLKSYLKRETKDKGDFIISNVQEELACVDEIINFNYTDIAERYNSNVFYIHGSLKEDYILLGFPFRMEPDVMDPRARTYAKEEMRQVLDFRRYLVKSGCLPGTAKFESLIAQMQRHIRSLFGLRGEYCFMPNEKLPPEIEAYGELHQFSQVKIPLKTDPTCVEQLIIMGHSIYADTDVYEELLNSWSNLKEVIIYTYFGQSEEEKEKQKAYFEKYSVSFRSYQ